MCPDYSGNTLFNLTGDKLSIKSTKIEFRIERCNKTKRAEEGLSPCKTEEEMKKFSEDLEVETWVADHKMDFNKMTNVPTTFFEKVHFSELLQYDLT